MTTELTPNGSIIIRLTNFTLIVQPADENGRLRRSGGDETSRRPGRPLTRPIWVADGLTQTHTWHLFSDLDDLDGLSHDVWKSEPMDLCTLPKGE